MTPILISLLACITVEPSDVPDVYVTVDDCCDCDTGAPADTGDPDPTDTAEPDGACDDFSPTEPGAFDPNPDCEADRPEVVLDAHVKWAWPNATTPATDYTGVIMTPVAAPLADAAGSVSVGVVFTAFTGTSASPSDTGELVVIDGETGSHRWSTDTINGDDVPARGGVALGDVSGDGLADICVTGFSVPMHCMESDGTLLWSASDPDGIGLETRRTGYPVIADLDADGYPEVILGRQIYSGQTGALLAAGVYGAAEMHSSHYGIPTTARLGSGSELSVIAGNAAYTWDGSTLTTTAFTHKGVRIDDGFPAVADLDGDSSDVEIVSVYGATVSIIESDGTVTSQWSLTESSIYGGPPTIADFDDDGSPEIGIAGKTEYVVYEVSGQPLWSASIWDESNMTGSSVFDFDGDGKAEVVYAGEERLHIYDGATGAERLHASGSFDPEDHASGTSHESPPLLDLNGDGVGTEILLASNQYLDSTGWTGVRAIASESDSWMPSRPVWNQHAYHITNVNDDGTIPAVQSDNWASWNSFRTQDQGDVPGDWLADLYPLDLEVCMDCETGEIVLYVPVVNDGIADAGPFSVDLYSGSVLIGSAAIGGLDSGSSMLVGPFITDDAAWAGSITAVIDGDEEVEECDEDNNSTTLDELPC